MRYFLAKRLEGPAFIVASGLTRSSNGSRLRGSLDSFIQVIRAWCRLIT